ncbi:MAG: hypothetical protein HKN33_10575 [Pyrinomonadaceae bacterium]|nr:hypothetical protein [Pyrinomonadaceae bacterium]
MDLAIDKILESDHREIDVILERLDEAFERGIVADIHFLTDYFWARLAMHIRAEHLHLFPAVLDAVGSKAGNAVSISRPTLAHAEEVLIILRSEHNFFMDELADVMKRLRRIVRLRDPVPAVGLPLIRTQIGRVVETLASHNAVEESEVYIWVEEMVSNAKKAKLKTEIARELKNIPPRFDSSNLQ